MDWLNVVCKWRSLFAGWQLGTRPKGDPESDAVRDHREEHGLEFYDLEKARETQRGWKL